MAKMLNKFRLKDTTETALTDYSLTSGTAVYSYPVDIRRQEGFASLLIKENKSGGAGDVDISAEYSIDGTNWYTYYTTNMAGTITAEGNIVTTLQNASRLIAFTVRQAHFIRFKFDPDADSQITADLMFQEEIT